MKAVVTVIGKDTVGILASTAQACAQKRERFGSYTVHFGWLFLHGHGHRYQRHDLRN